MTAILSPHTTAQRFPVQGTRRHNRGVVLRNLMREESASRADLARLTGLTRPTITEVIRELLETGVVIEAGRSTSSRVGKPSTMLEVDAQAIQSIVIDLTSPDRIVAAVCSPDAGMPMRREIARTADAADAVAGLVVDLAAELAGQGASPVLGVGIAVSLGAQAEGAACAQALAARPETAGFAVHVAAEADLIARAEAGHTTDEFLLVRLGEVISTSIVTEYTAGAPSARELAHLDVGDDAGRACRCGSTGCVHAWLAVLAERMTDAQDDDARRDLAGEAAQRLASPLAAIVSALDLPEVVLSGGSPLGGLELCRATEQALTAAQLPGAPVRVRCSTMSDAVLRGAAAHVLAVELA